MLPNVDDYWVLGNSFHRDYYVVHRPDDGVIAIAPTEKKLKKVSLATDIPTNTLAWSYDWIMMIIKLCSCAAVGAGTWALIAFVFGATGQNGISFLNKASLEEYKKKSNKH